MEETTKTSYMENDLLAGGRIEYFAGTVVRHEARGSEFLFECDNRAALRVHFLTPHIVRFRYAPDLDFPEDFSYAVDPAWQPEGAEVALLEENEGFRLESALLVVRVAKTGLKVTISDREGTVLSDDEKGFHWEVNHDFGGEIVMMSKHLQSGEHFYGLGDKSCSLELRGKRFQLWGTDTYGYGPETDPLYKNIPFYVGLHHKLSYGIFFDNSFRSHFDFGFERDNVTSFFAQGGEMNYYFIYGPSQREVAENYSLITGRPELPPLWALGYHQCKWSYESEAMVKEIASGFRRRKIPCDAIYLDIDYMDGFRCFTWNPETFPNPARMIRGLEEDGFKTVVMIDPGLKIDPHYWAYREGLERNYFCRRMDGGLMKGSVWPGLCCFPDFTHPQVREWWAGLYRGLIAEDGAHGVWNDMNEPAVFERGTFPRDVRHHYEGHRCSHRKAHNVYGMQMVRATREGLRRFGKGRRPFVITRSAYAGTQRFSSAWTGDNMASWKHLRIANVQCQRMSLSGMSFVGSDIGGFIETPEGELYVRWLQLAIFHPLCRTHSSGDHGDQEPWSFGEPYTSAARKAIELRYRLLPYLYTAMWQNGRRGTPVLRSLAFLAQDDPETYAREEEFGVGDHLLTCPVALPGHDGRWVYLPAGDWYAFQKDDRIEGAAEVWSEAPLEVTPLFVRAGTVLPLAETQQHVGEKPEAPLTLEVYHTEGTGSSELFEDAGDGYGEHVLKQFDVFGDGDRLTVRQRRSGDFRETYPHYRLVFRGLPFKPRRVEVDGKKADLEAVPLDFKELRVIG